MSPTRISLRMSDIVIIGGLGLAIAALSFVLQPTDTEIHEGPTSTTIPHCPEDAALIFDGDTNDHTDCITLDSFAGFDDWSARIGEIQAELDAERSN